MFRCANAPAAAPGESSRFTKRMATAPASTARVSRVLPAPPWPPRPRGACAACLACAWRAASSAMTASAPKRSGTSSQLGTSRAPPLPPPPKRKPAAGPPAKTATLPLNTAGSSGVSSPQLPGEHGRHVRQVGGAAEAVRPRGRKRDPVPPRGGGRGRPPEAARRRCRSPWGRMAGSGRTCPHCRRAGVRCA